ncbi:MAG: hypothetical protein Q9213_005675, partial [Squamulea squamosa]
MIVFDSRFIIFISLLSGCAFTTPLSLPPPELILNGSSIRNLGGPAAPPGFNMLFILDRGRSFDSNSFYLSGIDAMYHLAQEDWDKVVGEGHSRIVRGVQISYYDFPRSAIDLQIKHVVLAVLVGLNKMDRMDDFSTGIVQLRQDGRNIGIVRFGRPGGPAAAIQNGITNMTGVAGTAKREQPSTNPGSAPVTTSQDRTGVVNPRRIIDPDDHNLMIEYERYGSTFSCNLIFGAALDALASLAQYEADRMLGTFTGDNWSQKLIYQTFSLKRPSGELML